MKTIPTLEPHLVPASVSTRIIRVDHRLVHVPFRKPAKWSSGTRGGSTRLIVEVHTEGGIIGTGETICLWEFVEPVLEKTIVPLVVGQDACQIERICRLIEGAGYYHHKRAMVAAVAGLEMALWDVVGKLAGLPLCTLWGGAFRNPISLVAYVQCGDPDNAAEEAARYVEQGYGTVKVKIGMDPESDITIVKAVREAIGSKIHLRADVNGAWFIGTAKTQLRRLEKYEIQYVEQPLPCEDLPGHALLRKLSHVPIALDESAYTVQDAMSIIRHEAADVILIDPHQAGGLLQARKAAAVAESAGIPVTLHSGAELGLSTAAYLHLAASTPNLVLAIDSQYANQVADIITEPHRIANGAIAVPSKPGLGVTLDPENLRGFTVDNIQAPYLDLERPGWFPTKPQY